MNYLLVPGNPPAAHFYELWASEIKDQQPEASVKVSRYPSVTFQPDSQQAMDEILSVHLRQLTEAYQEQQKPVTVVGHSLGGYFALRLLEKAPEKIHQAILVHPFLRAPTLKGHAILKTVHALHGQTALQKIFIRSRKNIEKWVPDLAHLTKEEILSSFQLGRHEKATIGQDHSPLVFPPELRSKIKIFHTQKDTWCPFDLMKGVASQVTVQECTEPHDFITKAHHRQSLFSRIQSL